MKIAIVSDHNSHRIHGRHSHVLAAAGKHEVTELTRNLAGPLERQTRGIHDHVFASSLDGRLRR